jgi:hypothetical protein
MLHNVSGQKVTEVSTDYGAFIFIVKLYSLGLLDSEDGSAVFL